MLEAVFLCRPCRGYLARGIEATSQNSLYLRLCNIIMQETKVIQNHLNRNALSIGQEEAMHNRLKLGAEQVYERSSD
jgi:hypothetical protein